MIDQSEQYIIYPAERLEEVLSSLESKIKANRKEKCSQVVSQLIEASQLLDSYARKYTFGDRVTKGFIKRFDQIMVSLQKKASSPIQMIKSFFHKNPCRQSFQKLAQFYASQLYSKVLFSLIEQQDNPQIQLLKKQLKTHKENILNESKIKQELNEKPFNLKVQQITTIQDASQPEYRLHQIYEQMVSHYRDHQIDECYDDVQIYDNLLLAFKNPKATQQKLKHSADFIDRIKKEYEKMQLYHKNFQIQGWNLQQQEKLKTGQISFYTKYFPQNDQIGFMIEGQFDIPVQNFLAILTQIDLMDKYIPFAFDTQQVKKIDRNHKIGLARVYIPVLSDRQIFFSAYGYNRIKKNGTIFVYSRTITYDEQFKKQFDIKIPSDKESKYVRFVYNFFIVEYTPLSRTRAKVRIANNVDLKFKYLPYFLLYRTTVKFGVDYFKNVIKVNEKFKNSEWQKKIQQNPDLYGYFRQKINERFPEQ